MFSTQENRYIIRGVNEAFPKKIQLCCWLMIDEKVRKPKIQWDYLQIFEFIWNNQRGVFTIIHRQEEPLFIDDRTHQTMLLPDEY